MTRFPNLSLNLPVRERTIKMAEDRAEERGMESFDDHVEFLSWLVGELDKAFNFCGSDFKDVARCVCRRSRDLEFAVPSENIFDVKRLSGPIRLLNETVRKMSLWNAEHHDPDVNLYVSNVERRVLFLTNRAADFLHEASPSTLMTTENAHATVH